MGISTHLRVGAGGLSTSLDNLQSSGVGWIQEEIPWNLVQQTPDSFQWTFGTSDFAYDFDALLSEASNQKFNCAGSIGWRSGIPTARIPRVTRQQRFTPAGLEHLYPVSGRSLW